MQGLEAMIEKKKLYPITILRSLDRHSQKKLSNAGLVLVVDLVRRSVEELNEMTGIRTKKLKILTRDAKRICGQASN